MSRSQIEDKQIRRSEVPVALNYAIESSNQNVLADTNVMNSAVAGPATINPQRNSKLFEELWRNHSNQILRVTQRITRNKEDAEDALQDSFLRAYVNMHNFDGRSSLLTWLTRIAINSALMILRERPTSPQFSIDESADSPTSGQVVTVADAHPSPEAQYAQFEREAILKQSVRVLRPTIRQAIEFQSLEDHSIQETAQKMGLTTSATKSRIFHAKAALKKALKPKLAGRPRGVGRQLSPA
jgi:RNA polymerase sigma factor (sigma-70 family)